MTGFIKYAKIAIVVTSFQAGLFSLFNKMSNEAMYVNIQCSITEEDKNSETYQIFWQNNNQQYDAKNSFTYNYYENDINKTFVRVRPYINELRFDPFVGASKKNIRINKIILKTGKKLFTIKTYKASPKNNIKKISENQFESTGIDPQIKISNLLPFSFELLNFVYFNKLSSLVLCIIGMALSYILLNYINTKSYYFVCNLPHTISISAVLILNNLYINDFLIDSFYNTFLIIVSDFLIILFSIFIINIIKTRILIYLYILFLFLFLTIEYHIFDFYKTYLNNDILKYLNENKEFWVNNYTEFFNFIDYILLLINAVLIFIVYLPKLRLNDKYQKFNIIYPISLILLIISFQGIYANSVLGSLFNLISHVDEIVAEEKQPKSKRLPIDKIHSIKNRNFNIVIYINESLRAKNMSQYGYKRETDILTKKFFKNGFKFNYHIANAASTAPSLEIILSGCKSRYFEPQTRSQPLFWNYFSENYKTAYISSHYIEESYFDFFMSSSIKFHSSALSPNASSGRSDFETLLESEKFFRNVSESNERFAIVFNSIANHYPYLQDPDYIKYTPYSTSLKNVEESINAYDNTIKITDAVFDQFLKQLKSFGILDNTIIIYTSDHGQAFNEKGTFTHGSHVWQEILHVPLLVQLPRGITQNMATFKYNNFIKNQTSITNHEDLLPTIFDLFDCKIPEYLNGKSLCSQIPDRDIYSSTISNRYSVISTKDKSKRIIQNQNNDQNTTDHYKLGIDFDEYEVK